MATNYSYDLFISYARGDDEPFVKRIFNDLTSRGLKVWWDRACMPSRALTFLQEIRDAIDDSRRLLAVVGPKAVKSDYVVAEWEWAALFGNVLVPTLRLGDYKLLPDKIAKLHCIDFRSDDRYGGALEELLRILAEPILPLGILYNVPSLPPHFIPRKRDLEHVAQTVLADTRSPVVVTAAQRMVAIQGMAGIGKSVLAATFARSTESRRTFTDGIVWLTIGETPDLLKNLTTLGTVFDHDYDPSRYSDQEKCQARLALVLDDKRALIVLDDAWNVIHAEPFSNAAGPRCRLMVTTRDRALATALGAQETQLDILNDEEALRFLADWVGSDVASMPATASEVARECGNLPFALAIAGANAREGTSWDDLLQALREADLTFMEQQFPNYPYPNVLRALSVSVDALGSANPNGAKRFMELAVFPADEAVRESAVLTLWSQSNGMREREARKLLTQLSQKSLLRLEGEEPNRRVSLHDLQHDYLRLKTPDLTELHSRLLHAYRSKHPRGFHAGPNDGYFFQHVAYHMAGAHRWRELADLLLDPRYIRAKGEAVGYHELSKDFQWRGQTIAAIDRAAERALFQVMASVAQNLTDHVPRAAETLIENVLAHDHVGHLFVFGPPGSGKTALLKHMWIRDFRNRVFVNLFGGKMDLFTDCILPAINSVLPILFHEPPADSSASGAIEAMLSVTERWNRIHDLCLKSGKTLCVIVDGLDEFSGQLPTHLPSELPPTLCFVWGSRRMPGLDVPFSSVSNAHIFELGALYRTNTEINRIVVERLGQEVPPHLIQKLTELSQGSPLFLRFVIDEIKAAKIGVEALENFPRSLTDLLEHRYNLLIKKGLPCELFKEITTKLTTAESVAWDELQSARSLPASTLRMLEASGLFLIEKVVNRTLIRFMHPSILLALQGSRSMVS